MSSPLTSASPSGAPFWMPLCEGECPRAGLLIGEYAGQRDGGVGCAVVAVVEDQPPAAEIRPRGAGDLNELVRVTADVVVVDFVDEDSGRVRGAGAWQRPQKG
ncbi:MAG: hypothetical protein R2856_32150 [Caldilineaceae bacterium]